jgi:hypothetical protein
MKVAYRKFSAGSFTSWEKVLDAVSEFATSVGRENLINISSSEYGEALSTATIVVWYWK